MIRFRSGRVRAMLLAAVLTSGAVVIAEDLYIQDKKVNVLEGPGELFDAIDSVNQNVKVTVLERTDDGWVKVKTPTGKQGYIYNKQLAAKPASGGGSLFGDVQVTSDADASAMSTGAAGKGLEPEAETYAKNKNYSKANLDQIVALNKTVKGKDWMQFCQDGKVGPAKPKAK